MAFTIEDQIRQHRIIPVVTLPDVSKTRPLVDALVAGGLPLAEITLRTADALLGIEIAVRETGALIGAGSVMNETQCLEALAAGAQFIVSPGLDAGVVQCCLREGVLVIPGVSTATELQAALNLGVRIVKFFPAAAAGGLPMMESLAGPFPQMRFVPTGGVSLDNVCEYLAFRGTFAVGGSWMVKPELYANGDFSGVERATRAAVQKVQSPA
jgi:2-dehydro-3-deoxyphosphogluconate aldolase/(4S)-4-hydroxy-2-oxoglutarate aldolase